MTPISQISLSKPPSPKDEEVKNVPELNSEQTQVDLSTIDEQQADKQKKRTLATCKPLPPPPNPFLINGIDHEGKDALVSERRKKQKLESMGSHHSGLFHGYTYNPREEMRVAQDEKKIDKQKKTENSQAHLSSPSSLRNNDVNIEDEMSTFQNGYVYYENGEPILMREETEREVEMPGKQVVKKKPRNNQIVRPHSTNTRQPPLLDGYVLYEDGVPVMIFADPFSSDDEDEDNNSSSVETEYGMGEEKESDDSIKQPNKSYIGNNSNVTFDENDFVW
eukprot:g3057.t1